jgi:hypothetical protein
MITSACHKGMTGPVDAVALTTVAGTDTFDAGVFSVAWE